VPRDGRSGKLCSAFIWNGVSRVLLECARIFSILARGIFSLIREDEIMPRTLQATPKPNAKLDPKGTALVKRMKEIAQQARDSEHVGSIRIMPKSLPPSDQCACMCCCS
jgi:hypothetical protein